MKNAAFGAFFEKWLSFTWAAYLAALVKLHFFHINLHVTALL